LRLDAGGREKPRRKNRARIIAAIKAAISCDLRTRDDRRHWSRGRSNVSLELRGDLASLAAPDFDEVDANQKQEPKSHFSTLYTTDDTLIAFVSFHYITEGKSNS
jgi:hypothetical protein